MFKHKRRIAKNSYRFHIYLTIDFSIVVAKEIYDSHRKWPATPEEKRTAT